MLVLVLEEGKMAKVHYVVTSKKQEKKMTGSDWVITIVYYGVLVLLFTLYAAIALGRDIASFDSSVSVRLNQPRRVQLIQPIAVH